MIYFHCEICKERRPDGLIGVTTASREFEFAIVSRNVNFCKDKPECKRKAKELAKRDADALAEDTVIGEESDTNRADET